MTKLATSTLHAILIAIYKSCKDKYVTLRIGDYIRVHGIPNNDWLLLSAIDLGFMSRIVNPKPSTSRWKYLYKWNTSEPDLFMVNRVLSNMSIVRSRYNKLSGIARTNYIKGFTMSQGHLTNISNDDKVLASLGMLKAKSALSPEIKEITRTQYSFILPSGAYSEVIYNQSVPTVSISSTDEDSHIEIKISDLVEFGANLMKIAIKINERNVAAKPSKDVIVPPAELHKTSNSYTFTPDKPTARQTKMRRKKAKATREVRSINSAKAKEKFFNELPDKFTLADAITIGNLMSIAESTVWSYLVKFRKDKYIIKESRNRYTKTEDKIFIVQTKEGGKGENITKETTN